MFITASTSLLLLSLSCSFSTAIALWNQIVCSPRSLGPPASSIFDCLAIINSIPPSTYRFDPADPGDVNHPLNPISLQIGLRHKSLFPSMSRIGNCILIVEGRADAGFHPPRKAASAMFFTVWPNVKAQARRILVECRAQIGPGKPWLGEVMTRSELEGQWFPYEVTMIR